MILGLFFLVQAWSSNQFKLELICFISQVLKHRILDMIKQSKIQSWNISAGKGLRYLSLWSQGPARSRDLLEATPVLSGRTGVEPALPCAGSHNPMKSRRSQTSVHFPLKVSPPHFYHPSSNPNSFFVSLHEFNGSQDI